MTIKQNMSLLEALANGSMRFERTDISDDTYATSTGGTTSHLPAAPSDDISWAYQDDVPDMSPHEVNNLMMLFLLLTLAYHRKGR